MTDLIDDTVPTSHSMEETMTGEITNASIAAQLDAYVSYGELTEDGERRLKRCLEEALRIDPETAKIKWKCVSYLDPYQVFQDSPSVGHLQRYFARSPQSDVWVSWDDLPEEVQELFMAKIQGDGPSTTSPVILLGVFLSFKVFSGRTSGRTR